MPNPEICATASRIGDPQSWAQAWMVHMESGGWFDECTDEEILAAQQLLAEAEGVFYEPASAMSVAGTLRDIRNKKIPAGSTVICALTGHGLKDPHSAMRSGPRNLLQVAAERKAVEQTLLQYLR